MSESWWKSVKEKMAVVFSGIWDFLGPFVGVFLSKAGTALAQSAIQAVKVVAETAGQADGAEKREAAFGLIVNDLEKKGIEIGADVTSSMINAAIEVAVQKIKVEAPA
jgi:hypothetical protein